MKILFVSPYPPLRDGIATYAVQVVARLRREGNDVTVLSPGPSAAHLHLDLHGPRGGAALAKRMRDYDKVIIQFHPDFFFEHPCTDARRAATAAALAGAFRMAREVEVVVHEIDYRLGRAPGLGSRAMRHMFRAADRVLLHTEAERADFIEAFGTNPGKVQLLAHGESFVAKTHHDRDSARASLGIPPEATVFLAIGFIQPHKGFDRAMRAFEGLGGDDARLYVVGSLRLEEGEYAAHLAELRDLASRTEGVELVTGYVSDELFDRWIVAADCLVLPYRHIWSSGVAERAAIYHRPVIVTRVGGLAEQVADRPEVTLVNDNSELRGALLKVLGRGGQLTSGSWPAQGEDLRALVQAEVVSRAALRRGAPALRQSPGRAAVATQNSRSLSTRVRALPPLAPPAPISGRPGATLAKKLVQRAVGWLVDPIYFQVNALREVTVKALEEAQTEVARVATDQEEAGHPSTPSSPEAQPNGTTER